MSQSGCPIALSELEASDADYTDAVVLPSACYVDSAFYEFEMEAVFGHEWICLGRSDMVPEPGDYFTITVLGEPLIVVRSSSGEVNVMSAVCRHRGMIITAPGDRPEEEWTAPIPETKGNCRNFRCPYHWWTYDLDGRLIGAPAMDRTPGFERSGEALPRLRTEIWQGFVFVNLDEQARPLGPRLAALDEFLANYELEDMVTVDPLTVPDLPFNWKVMVENFMEGYHPDRLHHRIHGWAPSDAVFYFPYDEASAALYGYMGSVHPDGGFNPTSKALFPPIETLTEDERSRVPFVFVPPSLLIGFQSDSAFWFVVQPTAADTHTLSMAYVFPPSTVELPEFGDLLGAAISGVGLFNNQDLPTNTAIQQGLRSRFAPRGRYSWQESVLAQFNRWLIRRYRATAAGAGDDTESERVRPLTR
jgi:phenylpropionate dioxygenase-like ring-hydroxylating dioxygenase large terminal subunit